LPWQNIQNKLIRSRFALLWDSRFGDQVFCGNSVVPMLAYQWCNAQAAMRDDLANVCLLLGADLCFAESTKATDIKNPLVDLPVRGISLRVLLALKRPALDRRRVKSLKW
jgi:hypothetical protein